MFESHSYGFSVEAVFEQLFQMTHIISNVCEARLCTPSTHMPCTIYRYIAFHTLSPMIGYSASNKCVAQVCTGSVYVSAFVATITEKLLLQFIEGNMTNHVPVVSIEIEKGANKWSM